MPKTKNGSFILDDSSCDPYGVAKMREKMNGAKKNKTGNATKKSGVGKKKQYPSIDFREDGGNMAKGRSGFDHDKRMSK